MPRIGEQVWIGTTYGKAIYAGEVKIWPKSLKIETNDTATWTAPSWATAVEVNVLGGGGGGGEGGWLSSGAGGGAGQWGSDTWNLNGGETIKAFAGQGGGSTTNGADSTISMNDKVVIGNGGKQASMGNKHDGGTPPNISVKTEDQTYVFKGGAGGTNKKSGGWIPTYTATDGETPGGGGGYGYASGDKGGRGGNGLCCVVFRNCRKL